MGQANLNDTIAAVSTPLGEGGIGIVRLSGRRALGIADKIFVSKERKKPSAFKTYTTHYGTVVEDGQVIDEVILTVMRSPGSYTREDIVEINCHAGIVATRRVLELVLAHGCRLAEPGEFTQRAFLNGRIDLAQAEAVLDIIRAKTDSALKIGTRQLEGLLSREIRRTREALLEALSLLEANIDFPEEDPGRFESGRIRQGLVAADEKLKGLLESSKSGRVFREGIHVVICGKPNVGKSSLLNALLKYERSIVTPVAGTTRDTVEEIIDIKGIPVRIVDTAGLLKPRGVVEKKAVERSKEQIDRADLALILFDGSRRITGEDRLLISKLKNKNVIAVINKIDLKQRIEEPWIRKTFKFTVGLSAKIPRNIHLLEDAISGLIFDGSVCSGEPLMIANLRHVNALRGAQILIAQALDSLDNKLSSEFIAQDVKEALVKLDELLGMRFSEDLLDRIFGEFCIGK